MRHLLTPLYWAAFFLLLGIGILLLWCMASPAGTQWLMNQAVAKSSVVRKITGVSGTLLNHPAIAHFEIASRNATVSLDDLRLDYRMAPLSQRRFTVRQLEIGRLQIALTSTRDRQEKQPDIRLPEFSLPFRLRFNQVHIGELEITLPGRKPLLFRNIELVGEMQDNRLEILTLAAVFDKLTLRADGQVNFSSAQTITLNSTLEYAQQATATMTVTGTPQAYRFSAQISSGKINRIPAMTTSVTGSGTLRQIAIESLQAQTMAGEVIANGTLGWHNGLAIDASFSGHDIDPGKLDPRYPGKISFGGQAHLQGGLTTTQFAVLGNIRHFPFQIEADADIEKKEATIRNGRLIMGANTVHFTGHVNRQRAENIHFQVNAPQLSALYPPVTGRLAGKGTLKGEWLAPQIDLHFTGHSLGYRKNRIRQLELTIAPAAQIQTIGINLDIRGLQREAVGIDTIHLEGIAGKREQRGTLRISDTASRLRSQLSFSGEYDNQQASWLGKITNTAITALQLPQYRQQEPATLSISRDALQLSRLCLTADGEQLCAQAGLLRQQPSTASLHLNGFAINHLAAWIPIARLFRETIDASVEFKGDANRYAIRSMIRLDEKNLLRGVLDIDPTTLALDGKIRGEFRKLEWLALLSDEIMMPRGRFLTRVDIGGSLGKPELRGMAEITDASLQLPLAGIKLQDIRLTARSDTGNQAALSGQVTSGEGKIAISGKLDWSNLKNRTASVKLSGKDFMAADLPNAKVWISPDLHIDARRQRIDVSGTVVVPRAEITFSALPETAVQPTADEVILDEATDSNSSHLNVYSRVTIVLGKRVHLSGFGLDTGLKGSLQISETPDKAISGDGSFQVVDGRYEALGQKLTIQRGEIYFNGPLNQPGINLRAVREDDGITTGLEISGPIQRPESRIFSDPVMDETNALSYLLTGKPMGAAGSTDSAMLLSAVARLGIKSSSGLINDIRTRSGLDLLTIKPGEELSQSSVVIGKYLSPKLYLEYATSLFEDSSVLSMQYRLNRYLQLEAESGNRTQSIDLIYQIEN